MPDFENNLYCDFSEGAVQAVAGKDIILAVFDSTGADLLAVAGQQGLTINRSKDTFEVNSKTTKGGWKSYLGGMKEWSIDNDGLYVADDESHKTLSKAFNDDELVCLKVLNQKTKKAMFGGLAIVTDYPIEAPFDDAVTYTATLSGFGPLTDLSDVEGADQAPDEVEADPETMAMSSQAQTETKARLSDKK